MCSSNQSYGSLLYFTVFYLLSFYCILFLLLLLILLFSMCVWVSLCVCMLRVNLCVHDHCNFGNAGEMMGGLAGGMF